MGGLFAFKKSDKADFMLALGTLCIFITLVYAPLKPKKMGDGNFHVETKKLVTVLLGDGDWNNFRITKAPGPNLYYAIPYALKGTSGEDHAYWLAGIVWNLIFMILAVLLVKRIGSQLFGPKAGIFAGVLMLLFPVHIYYAMGINGESMVYISFILLLYGGIKWTNEGEQALKSRGWWYFLLGSISLILARLNFVVVVPLLILFLLARVKVKNPGYLRRGLLIYCFFIVVFAVALRITLDHLPGNKGHHYHDNYSAYVLHLGRFQFREEPWDWRFWQSELRSGSQDYIQWMENEKTLNEKIEAEGRLYSKVYHEWVIDDYISYPLMTLKQFLVKAIYGNIFIVNSLQPDNFNIGPIKGKTGYFVFHAIVNVVNLFIIIGFLGFIWTRKNVLLNTYWLILILFLSFIGFYAMTYMEPRYMFPVRVIYILTASEFWLSLFRKQVRPILIKKRYINETQL